MSGLMNHVDKVRSKNAGPFWVTIDIFCKGLEGFQCVSSGLGNADVCKALHANPDDLKRFDIEDLAVIKLSIPRPQVQGTVEDRDMHGAAIAVLIEELLSATSIS